MAAIAHGEICAASDAIAHGIDERSKAARLRADAERFCSGATAAEQAEARYVWANNDSLPDNTIARHFTGMIARCSAKQLFDNSAETCRPLLNQHADSGRSI